MNYFEAASPIIGGRIRSERVRRGMTQSEFASMLSISISYLGALERGTRVVSRSVMDKLHNVLGMSYDYLIEGLEKSTAAGASIVCEPEFYRVRRSAQFLLNSCSSDEIKQCYKLINTYLDCLHGPSSSKD